MAKRKRTTNARQPKPAAGNKADDQPKGAGTQAPAPDDSTQTPADGGGSGGDGAAGPETEVVSEAKGEANGTVDANQEAATSEKPAKPATDDAGATLVDSAVARDVSGPKKDAEAEAVTDPDGNLPSGEAPGGGDELPRPDPVHVAMYAAEQIRNPVAVQPEHWDDEVLAFEALAEFFRTFPDSPDDSGLVQLERLKIPMPEEHRPGLLIAMIRVFRCALDQLDRLDREDTARAEAAKPKPAPEKWREPRGFKQTRKAMDPTSGLKTRR